MRRELVVICPRLVDGAEREHTPRHRDLVRARRRAIRRALARRVVLGRDEPLEGLEERLLGLQLVLDDEPEDEAPAEEGVRRVEILGHERGEDTLAHVLRVRGDGLGAERREPVARVPPLPEGLVDVLVTIGEMRLVAEVAKEPELLEERHVGEVPHERRRRRGWLERQHTVGQGLEDRLGARPRELERVPDLQGCVHSGDSAATRASLRGFGRSAQVFHVLCAGAVAFFATGRTGGEGEGMESSNGAVVVANEADASVRRRGHCRRTPFAASRSRSPAGKATAVMGPSGSGKSTLMHILAGLDKPTSGSVRIAGTEITTLGDNDLTKLRREHIGFVFQFFNLLPMLTAEGEHHVLPLTIAGEKPEDELGRPGRGETSASSERLTHRPSELSGGQQQRVAIARALDLEADRALRGRADREPRLRDEPARSSSSCATPWRSRADDRHGHA